MQSYRLHVVLGIVALFSAMLLSTPALAATPSFTITATNATLSSNTSSGAGTSTFTLTSVNGYAGSIIVGCQPPTPPAGVKVPICSGGYASPGAIPAQPPITLAANQVVTGTVPFYNMPVPVPVSLPRRGGHGIAPGLALAGALLLGFGFRRMASRWLMLTLLAAATLAGLAGISACGGNNSVVTPGTYAYTITATDTKTAVAVNTSINVMVP